MGDQDHIARQPLSPTSRPSRPDVRDIFERFDFYTQVDRLAKAGLLYQVTEKFANIDLHPDQVEQPPDGAGLRGADPQVRRTLQRDRRGALHPARSHPPDGQPAVHRGRRRPDQARRGAHHLRPHRGHRRHAVGRRRIPGRAQPAGAAHHVRAGTQRRVLRHLQGRHAHQGAGCRQHRLRQHPVRRRPPAPQVRLHALQSAVRRGVEEGREGGPQGTRAARASTAASAPACRASPTARCCSCCTSVQDAPGQGRRQPLRHRAQRLAAVHRRRGSAAKAKSAATCWKTTWWRPSSACPPTCSTTPASPPMSGFSPTASRSTARARCN